MAEVEPDIAGTAALLADRSRVLMLRALEDGRALPAGELARAARIGAASASAHLRRLAGAGLVEAVPQGRHRYYRLASSRLPELMEALAALAPAAPHVRSRVPPELRLARWCYGHLGGSLAVAMAQALAARGVVTALEDPCIVTAGGAHWLREAGVAAGGGERLRVRLCAVDWSERRPHLAGPLGRALARALVEGRCLVPVRASRALRLTDRGRAWFRERLGLEADG